MKSFETREKSIDAVLEMVAKFYGCDKKDLTERGKQNKIVSNAKTAFITVIQRAMKSVTHAELSKIMSMERSTITHHKTKYKRKKRNAESSQDDMDLVCEIDLLYKRACEQILGWPSGSPD